MGVIPSIRDNVAHTLIFLKNIMPSVWVMCMVPAHLAMSSILFSAHRNLKACKLLRSSCCFLSQFRTFASNSQWPGREEKRRELMCWLLLSKTYGLQLCNPTSCFSQSLHSPICLCAPWWLCLVPQPWWWPGLVLSLWDLLQGRAQEHGPGHRAQSLMALLSHHIIPSPHTAMTTRNLSPRKVQTLQLFSSNDSAAAL